MLFNFVGGSYVYRTVNYDLQRSINLYPATSESGNSKGHFILCPTPGRVLFSEIPVQSIRGFYQTADRAFVVAYDTLYEILSDGSYTPRGTLDTFSGNVSMADNGIQLIIVDGTATGGWILDLTDGTYVQITAPAFEGGTTVCFIDGYFLLNVPNSGIYQWSGIYDGTAWGGADTANAEGSPDDLVAVVTVHRQVALIGGNTIQFIDNTGSTPDPFENIQGVFIEYGTIAPFSVQQVANTIFWIGKDKSGGNVVWMAEGYQPSRISTNAIENYLSQYDTTNATSYSYQEDGHYFVVWNIEGMPTSLVYDVNEKQWHERGFWNSNAGLYQRDRANFHVYMFGKHLVSDYENGNIYEQSLDYNDDNTNLIRRQRTLPYFTDDLEFLYFSEFQIDMQTGVGLVTDANDANINPVINLRWSDDGGHTWSTEIAVPIGKTGAYNTRAIWRRLGRSRARVWECSIAANVPVYLIAAHLKVSKGYA